MQATLAVESSTEQALHFLELSATPKKDNDLAQKYKAPYIPIDLKSSFYEEKAPTENSRSVQSTHPSRDATQDSLTWSRGCNKQRLRAPVRCLVAKEEFRMEKCEL